MNYIVYRDSRDGKIKIGEFYHYADALSFAANESGYITIEHNGMIIDEIQDGKRLYKR